LTLLFQGADEQQQSTRRGWEGKAGRTALGTRSRPLKRREDSVAQTAVPHKQRSREEGAGYAAESPQTTGGQRRADGCSPQTEPVFGVDHRYYCLLAIEKMGDWKNLEILVQNQSF